jgi:hypothetical protein
MTTTDPFLTVGAIARQLGRPIHRIEYVIRSRRIRPAGWAGHARVFLDSDLAVIAGELHRIAAARGEELAESNGGTP